MAPTASIVWFRNDLRLDDNPALQAAISRGGAVVPIFIWDPDAEGDWPLGGASRCWLHGSLASLQAAVSAVGSRLVIRQGKTLSVLLQLIKDTAAGAVFWNKRYEPAIIKHDQKIEAALDKKELTVESFHSHLLFEPGTVLTKSSTPFKVFTPFYRACLALPEPNAPLPPPKALASLRRSPASLKLNDLGLLPRIPWDVGIRSTWQMGEAACAKELHEFIHQSLSAYLDTRDRPDWLGTSRLSPSLHFGELSPRRVWHAVREAVQHFKQPSHRRSAEGYIRQLVWREFAYHLLYHFPNTADAPLNERFNHFRWRKDSKALSAWQRGKTGYPIIDAGMRQLWTTGWMHNRLRMLVGSFLVKDLFISWLEGAKWFWDTLVDADLANNTLGWQWVAGCGADAAPFFRIFNPVSQGQKFDPDGAYVRQWVPELANLPDRWIHKPWQAPAAVLQEAGIVLGRSYPFPLVDHDEARKRALEELK